jgi:hypothetical protein
MTYIHQGARGAEVGRSTVLGTIEIIGRKRRRRLDFNLQPISTSAGLIRSGLERLSSGNALEEVRGAVREYRDAEKRHARAGRWR